MKKCDNCKYQRLHKGTTLSEYSEGINNPYEYKYCSLGKTTYKDKINCKEN